MSSECSSGCQSGWTTYFVHSSEDGESFRRVEEEDLSMISDASSGPQHFNEVNGNGYCYLYSALLPADGGKKKRTLVEPQQIQRSSVLDDTASSHLLTNSKNSFTDCNYQMKESMEEIVDFPYDFSTTQFQANSALRMQMGHSQSSVCAKPTATRPGSRKKGRKMY
ncbi:protein SOB FIVE-LIKE 5-like [Zingiber officinale]|uniref:protein SOB FIVE-LIKE 5-like n=1 Tax=Zingiber officinale TaxID=94328 RepID=UPI001C4D40D1|nr:protein SOB FIVE-LIKE 5-like [Zingiber officinale]